MVTIESYYTDYYFAEPCYKIAYLYEQILGATVGPNVTSSLYPTCKAYFDGSDFGANAAVQGQYLNPKGPEQVAAIFDMTFGASIWLAFFLHGIGIEIYVCDLQNRVGFIAKVANSFLFQLKKLRLTPAEHNRLRQVSYEKQLEAGMRNPGSAGTTVQKFGDAPPWVPEHKDAGLHQDGPGIVQQEK